MNRLIILIVILCSSVNCYAKSYITLSPHLTEILFDLEVGEQIVATVEHSDYPEQARDIPTIGNFQGLNIESIVALQPDVIFAWPDGNPDLQLQRLEQLGFHVFKSSPQNLTQLLAEIRAIGKLVNQTERAQQISTELEDEIEHITTLYQSQEQLSAVYQVWHQPLRALGSDPWLNDVLTRCGITNIFSHLPQAYPLVSIEAVVAKQPDIIILPETNKQRANDELWQKWPSVSAVKKEQIVTINADWLHRYTRRSILGISSLCKAVDAIRRKQKD